MCDRWLVRYFVSSILIHLFFYYLIGNKTSLPNKTNHWQLGCFKRMTKVIYRALLSILELG
ncbi:hypothetical protein DM01DRAFT_1101269 [Hesseltinella vesiculosa]|uniref:Uncharacterized protein n=1 Tax=Hesseltinella vesiculosa TaxID=101127 RepID=A0A1X2GB83_9FUNG|nr:hypothetical protein DM01DRAFT_1101269 [Hesseltinella vesiculosa]